MRCIECDSEIPEGGEFCIDCGAPVKQAVTGQTISLGSETHYFQAATISLRHLAAYVSITEEARNDVKVIVSGDPLVARELKFIREGDMLRIIGAIPLGRGGLAYPPLPSKPVQRFSWFRKKPAEEPLLKLDNDVVYYNGLPVDSTRMVVMEICTPFNVDVSIKDFTGGIILGKRVGNLHVTGVSTNIAADHVESATLFLSGGESRIKNVRTAMYSYLMQDAMLTLEEGGPQSALHVSTYDGSRFLMHGTCYANPKLYGQDESGIYIDSCYNPKRKRKDKAVIVIKQIYYARGDF